MNKENEYYIPDIEDFRVGYEYEVFSMGKYFDAKKGALYPENEREMEIKWRPYKFSNLGQAIHLLIEFDKGHIRTPYLTKEQIEAEGWKHEWWGGGAHLWTKGGIVLTSSDQNHRLLITHGTGYIIFQGECKSINEFRYICKLLEI